MQLARTNGLYQVLKQCSSQALPELVGNLRSILPVEDIAQNYDGRTRIFSYARTFWLFLYQILGGNLSLDTMVKIAQSWLWSEEQRAISSNTSALSQARKRMPTGFLRQMDMQVQTQFAASRLFQGYHVKVTDGTGISLPDTPEQRKTYPPHPKAGKHSGFPTFKLLGLFDLENGSLLEWATGSIITSDSELYRLLWPHLKPNDLVIGDRHFCGFAYFATLQTLRVQSLARKHQMRKHAKLIKQLGKDDRIVEWEKPAMAPKWIASEDWQRLPDSLQVREITFNVSPKGFRTEKITIITTVLDETIPAAEWAELYFHRWKVEVNFRDIKITMGMDVLRARTPKMAEKEVQMYFIAYNLIRLLMQKAATINSADLSKISFKSTAHAIMLWGPILAKAKTSEEYEEILEYLFKIISYPRCRNRKNRTEPRARKRRPKNYQLLCGDRHQFKEIKHRSRYKKAA